MKTAKNSLAKLFFLLIAISTANCFAEAVPSKDPIAPADFVNGALISGAAQVESAKLALQQSSSPEIKEFAQLIIDERSRATTDLTAIANKKHLRVISGSELLSKANAFILKANNNENFDAAYLQNQVKARADEIELFNKGALSKDPELAGFATENIPKLSHNLHLAETLAEDFAKRNPAKPAP